MLARLQKIVVLCWLAAAGVWGLVFWRGAPVLAAVGCAVILFGYAAVLALDAAVLHATPARLDAPDTSVTPPPRW